MDHVGVLRATDNRALRVYVTGNPAVKTAISPTPTGSLACRGQACEEALPDAYSDTDNAPAPVIIRTHDVDVDSRERLFT